MAKPPSPPRNVEEAKSDMEAAYGSLNSVVESLEAGGVHPAAIVIISRCLRADS